jgi:flavin reductase (DIM6/NTAB) family NADH-FMN oxidoreductase RutF
MSVEAANELAGALDHPMFIVTAAAGGERAGCLAGFVTQCSIDPLGFLVCLSHRNRTFRVARDAELLVVHLVPERALALAELFGAQTGDEVDKFERCAWTPGPGGAPVLDECASWFAGRVLRHSPAGDHAAFLLEPVQAQAGPREAPLMSGRALAIDAGHEP